MPWFVYIIQSEMDGTYYKGSSQDPYKRLLQHNAGESFYNVLKFIEDGLAQRIAH
jgi:predicted GIY-YIG superfamily endonuclease